ncbi:TolC family protein [Dyadobacter psychrotolerans]|uniref:TolC family protein n=1 Tax=Dyadobacter psychrotolerans TaxID=2541721 RepID=A0A4R5E1H8_9BACT|nr:TolC family protein [Dyadobacter psychrotolerans]TDE17633.1 TolC family protein [Dyadobacter psychrotolerans]
MAFKVIKMGLTMALFWFFTTARAQTIYNLQQALQTARTNNPVLKREQYNVSISQAEITTASLRPNPIVNNQSLQLIQPNRFPEQTGWANGANRQVWWQITKPFQLPMQRENKINFAEQNVRLSQKQYTETERSLFREVAQKWLDVWAAGKQLDILENASSNIDSLVNINKLRLKNQVITNTDLARTELLANQYAIQIKSAKQIYENELTNLKFLLGTAEPVQIDTTDRFQFAIPSQMDALIQDALKKRSDVQTIRSKMDVAEANIKLQKSSALPTPELGLIYNPQNKTQYMGVFATLGIPIFSRNQGEIKKSETIRQQAEQDLKTTELQIQSEILTAYRTYQTQNLNVQNFSKLLTQSQSILGSVKYSYLRGGTTIIDLLEAQRSWLDTQHQYYDILQQYRQSYIDLLYTSGLINQFAQ